MLLWLILLKRDQIQFPSVAAHQLAKTKSISTFWRTANSPNSASTITLKSKPGPSSTSSFFTTA